MPELRILYWCYCFERKKNCKKQELRQSGTTKKKILNKFLIKDENLLYFQQEKQIDIICKNVKNIFFWIYRYTFRPEITDCLKDVYSDFTYNQNNTFEKCKKPLKNGD